MMAFTEIDSKEIKFRRMNGWLRLSVWTILFLVAVGSLGGLLYWRRTVRADAGVKQGRENAVEIIVKALWIKDSLDLERHKEVMAELRKTHKPGQVENEPERLNEAALYEQLQQEKK